MIIISAFDLHNPISTAFLLYLKENFWLPRYSHTNDDLFSGKNKYLLACSSLYTICHIRQKHSKNRVRENNCIPKYFIEVSGGIILLLSFGSKYLWMNLSSESTSSFSTPSSSSTAGESALTTFPWARVLVEILDISGFKIGFWRILNISRFFLFASWSNCKELRTWTFLRHVEMCRRTRTDICSLFVSEIIQNILLSRF